MSIVKKFIKFLKPSQIQKSPATFPTECLQYWRGFADKPKMDTPSKQIVIHGPNKEEKLRVRRARPADVPRVLRFVRENARVAWPGFANPNPNFNLILGDYVSRALAQGHSMLAEQQEAKLGWSQIKGLAISSTVCPWDAMMLEQWARCVRCKRSRQLIHFTAHCLRAPALHDKYRTHNILQVILIVPPEVPRATEIIHMLAKNTMKRGREAQIPVLRFDVTDTSVATVLDELSLIKEWELSYNLLPDAMKERKAMEREDEKRNYEKHISRSRDVRKEDLTNKEQFIAVYTATNNNQ